MRRLWFGRQRRHGRQRRQQQRWHGGRRGHVGIRGTSGSAGAAGSAGATGAGGATALPEGNTGIASRHPGDVGIGSDPDVIFADDFEGYTRGADLNNRWDAVYQNQYVDITTDAANVYRGGKALQFTLPQQTAELSDATDKMVSPEQDVLFLRYYSKFQPPYDVVGSSHNGSSISAHYFINGQATPGVPADGTNKFLANLENWRGEAATPSPGDLNIYLYHPEQREPVRRPLLPERRRVAQHQHPFTFGPGFVSRPDIIPQLDRWYCYEYMLKANTPGQRDGRIAVWLDGRAGGRLPGPAPARRRDAEDRPLRSVVPHRLEPERAGAQVVRQRRRRQVVHRADRTLTREHAIRRGHRNISPRV